MASWSDYQRLLNSTVRVSVDREKNLVEGWQFKPDSYDPPKEMGLSAQVYVIVPALHVYSYTGQKALVNDVRFRFSINLN